MAADVLGCEVLIDGVRFADGREGDDLRSPLALDGLAITWGRATTIDQPEPSTCTFEVMDAPGGRAFLQMLRTGATVEVRSRVIVADGGGASTGYPTLPDPGFDLTPVGAMPGNVQPELGADVEVVDLGGTTGHALDVVKVSEVNTTVANMVRVLIAPGTFVDGDPDAWATLPRVGTDSQWTYQARVLAPVNSAVHLQAAYIGAPDGLDVNGAGSSTVVNVQGTGQWETLEHDTFTLPGTRDEWLGLWVQVTYTPWRLWPAAEVWETVAPTALTWADLSVVHVDDAQLTQYGESLSNELVVFGGAITDLSVAWDESLPPEGGARVKVTATDFSAGTANIYLGEEPWAVEPMRTRFMRVITLLNQTHQGYGYGAVVDPDLGAMNLGYQDIDNQAALGLLTSFAESVDGVLWPAVHVTYPRRYFYVEDINKRSSGIVLRLGSDGYVEVDRSGLALRTQLSACYVLRDPISFEQTSEDTPTRVAVGWQEQTTDENGKPAPTDRTVELVDTEEEQRLGVHRLQTSTLLTTEDDAEWHAGRKLRRLTTETWRALGLVYDLDIHAEDDEDHDLDLATQARAAMLLDGTTRIGLPLVLTDIPAWAPTGSSLPVYVEGGSYEFNGGRWVLSLVISNVYGAGSSAAWNDLPPEWLWTTFPPNADAVLNEWDGTPGASSSTQRDGVGTVLRRNNAANPQALAAGGRWGYQVGTGETGTTTYVTNATDGPWLPDGTRATSYARRTITAPKTGITSGWFYRASPGDIAGTAGQQFAVAFYVRASVAAPTTPSLQTRLGTTVLATATGTPNNLLPKLWTRVGNGTTATADFDGYQLWSTFSATTILPAGTTIDVAAVLVDPDAFTLEPYFDGDTVDWPGTQGAVSWDDLAAALVAEELIP